MADDATISVQFQADEGVPAVPNSPFSLPSKLRRKELNEIINHLLNNENPEKFEFIIAGDLLRGSLQRFLEKRGMSTETVCVVRYFLANPMPEENLELSHPDWISGVRLFCSNNTVTASYDGSVNVWTGGNLTVQKSGHSMPIKALELVDRGDAQGFVTGGQDKKICVWEYKDNTLNCFREIPVSQTVEP